MSAHARPEGFHAVPTGRTGNLAPALATLMSWIRPACLRKRRRRRELMPELRRLTFGRAHHWRRADVEAFADAPLSTDGAARPAVRAD